VADPDRQIRGVRGGGEGGHPDPEIRGDCPFGLKIRGAGPFPASSTVYAADQIGTF